MSVESYIIRNSSSGPVETALYVPTLEGVVRVRGSDRVVEGGTTAAQSYSGVPGTAGLKRYLTASYRGRISILVEATRSADAPNSPVVFTIPSFSRLYEDGWSGRFGGLASNSDRAAVFYSPDTDKMRDLAKALFNVQELQRLERPAPRRGHLSIPRGADTASPDHWSPDLTPDREFDPRDEGAWMFDSESWGEESGDQSQGSGNGGALWLAAAAAALFIFGG